VLGLLAQCWFCWRCVRFAGAVFVLPALCWFFWRGGRFAVLCFAVFIGIGVEGLVLVAGVVRKPKKVLDLLAGTRYFERACVLLLSLCGGG
jgi:hypothetical protein